MKNTSKKYIIKVDGMTCSNCASGIEKKMKLKGLDYIKVNFSTSEAICSSKKFTKKEVESFIEELGYSIKKYNVPIKIGKVLAYLKINNV